MHQISEVKVHLGGMLSGAELNDVINIEAVFERAANNMLSKIDPIETARTQPLTTAVHDDIYNYPLPNDYKKLIDIFPEDDRNASDIALRTGAQTFGKRATIDTQRISIEASEGTKFIRINWKSRGTTTFNTCDSLTANGTWSAVTGASTPVIDSLFKISGSGSLKFNITSSGGGIKNSTMTAINLTTWDEEADFFQWYYFESVANLTSVTGFWGNDLTTNYWTSVAQTAQADGTAFKVGWNLIKFPWSSATETGTVAPATIDSFQATFQTSGTISNVRADNVIVSLGRLFDFKYYSQFLFRSVAGTFLSQTTNDTDYVVVDGTSYNIFLYESLDEISQQLQGEASTYNHSIAVKKLYGDPESPSADGRTGLYQKYRGEYPTQAKKQIANYYGRVKFRR